MEGANEWIGIVANTTSTPPEMIVAIADALCSKQKAPHLNSVVRSFPNSS